MEECPPRSGSASGSVPGADEPDLVVLALRQDRSDSLRNEITRPIPVLRTSTAASPALRVRAWTVWSSSSPALPPGSRTTASTAAAATAAPEPNARTGPAEPTADRCAGRAPPEAPRSRLPTPEPDREAPRAARSARSPAEQGRDSPERWKLIRALGASRQMALVRARARPDRAGRARTARDRGGSQSRKSSSSTCRASARSAYSVRDLTVPSGIRSRSATCACVRPAEYCSSSTSRCAGVSAASASPS